jgi:citrate lyase subunit beta/citryl-CoA lyase
MMFDLNEEARHNVDFASTWLFVPGNRPDRFNKAMASGADVVIFDLEDAVAASEKTDARRAVGLALTQPSKDVYSECMHGVVRVNSLPELLEADLDDLKEVLKVPSHGLRGVMVPKVEDPSQVAYVVEALGDIPVIPLIETALGIVNVNAIAFATGVSRMAFGAVDFARDVDATHRSLFDSARAQIVIASAAAGLVAPIDSPCVSIRDQKVIKRETKRAAACGFTAKMCIHPEQLDTVMRGLYPSKEQVAWAVRVVELEGGATQLDGEMIDKPVVDRAKRILQRASWVQE